MVSDCEAGMTAQEMQEAREVQQRLRDALEAVRAAKATLGNTNWWRWSALTGANAWMAVSMWLQWLETQMLAAVVAAGLGAAATGFGIFTVLWKRWNWHQLGTVEAHLMELLNMLALLPQDAGDHAP